MLASTLLNVDNFDEVNIEIWYKRKRTSTNRE